MHIYYATILGDVALFVGAILVVRFLLLASDAAKAITKDHNGYVDSLEVEVMNKEDELMHLQEDVRHYTHSLSRVSEKVQAERLAELEAKMEDWPKIKDVEVYESWRPIGPWGVPHDVPLVQDGPLTTTNDPIGPMVPHRDLKSVKAEHEALVAESFQDEMDMAGYPMGDTDLYDAT
jgi:hypothetical protein